MARLGKRERAEKRAIIHGNLSAPKPELERQVIRTKAGALRVVAGDAIGSSSSERLKAVIGVARGGFTRFGSDATGGMAPRFGTPQAKGGDTTYQGSAEIAARYDTVRHKARALDAINRASEKKWGCKAT